MFRCAAGHNTKAGEPCVKVVTETRPKEYFDRTGHLVGRGTEIVKEQCFCTEHAGR